MRYLFIFLSSGPRLTFLQLVFQITVRMATCDEIASDLTVMKRAHALYWTLEKTATPVALLLPWFPGNAKRASAKATMELFLLLNTYVQIRRDAKVPSLDAFDMLLSAGYSNQDVIRVRNSAELRNSN